MSRPWFPFYVGDYTRDTARLTTEAHGAYLLLMLDYWVNGAPPDDDETLATITKLPVSIWRKRRPALAKFFKIKDGMWTHARIEKEKAKAEEVGASNSDKAREAAERRWAKEREKKLGGQSEHCSADAPSIDLALPQNAQSQSQPPSNPDSEKGESNSRSVLKLVEDGKGDRPIPIDETYQPSDRAVEYAFSLGMKKADLDDELRKFIAKSISVRVVSFNIDMNFKLWCDRWLEFKRKHNPDWKPAPAEAASAPMEDRSGWPIVVDGTLEHTCWNAYNREKGLRPLFMCKQLRPDGTVIDRGARCETLFPPGFNDFGERIEPASEDAA
jgi:uncharacterized protein YdaU (DUF1376 family)